MEVLDEKVYKYLSRKHAIAMLEMGQIKIGTLFSYRDDEVKAREDQREGTKTLFAKKQTYKPEDIPQRLIKDKFLQVEGNVNITFSNYTIGMPNAYVYCVSKKISKQIMESFTDCDTIVEISNYKFVFENINYAFYNAGMVLNQSALYDCDYSGRIYDGDNTDGNPFRLKDPEYAYQEEMRLVMIPTTKVIEPIVVEFPDLVPYLKIFEI